MSWSTPRRISAAVKRITAGRGVDVVYDAVGLDTYMRSMDALRPRGMLALYGEASGLVPPIDPRELLFRKSLFLTRTGLDHYIADRRELRSRTDEIFAWVADGRLKQKIFGTYRLEEVADAHRAIEFACNDRQAVGDPVTASGADPPRLPLVEKPEDPLAREAVREARGGKRHPQSASDDGARAGADEGVRRHGDGVSPRQQRCRARWPNSRSCGPRRCSMRLHLGASCAAGARLRRDRAADRRARALAGQRRLHAGAKGGAWFRRKGGAAARRSRMESSRRCGAIISPREIVELAMLVGFYVSTAIFIKALAVPDEKA